MLKSKASRNIMKLQKVKTIGNCYYVQTCNFERWKYFRLQYQVCSSSISHQKNNPMMIEFREIHFRSCHLQTCCKGAQCQGYPRTDYIEYIHYSFRPKLKTEA